MVVALLPAKRWMCLALPISAALVACGAPQERVTSAQPLAQSPSAVDARVGAADLTHVDSPEFLRAGAEMMGEANALAELPSGVPGPPSGEAVPDTPILPVLSDPVDISAAGVYDLPIPEHDFGRDILDQSLGTGFISPGDFREHFDVVKQEVVRSDDGRAVVRMTVQNVVKNYVGFRLWVF